MVDIIDQAKRLARDLIGTNGPDDQIIASLLLGAVIIATSVVGLVGTLLLLPIPLTALVIGILRLWRPIDKRYPL